MMTNVFLCAALTLALSTALTACASEGASPVLGVWRMTSFEAGAEGALRPVPYSGQAVFTEAGTLSVQAMNADADAPDTPFSIRGYEALYGPVVVDYENGTYALTVESSLVRSLIGQRVVNRFEVSGDQLVIMPLDPVGGWRVTYERQ
jgi:hypothetical protein